MDEMMSWYAVFVKTGDEENVKKRIDTVFGEEVTAYNPKRELIERKAGKLSRRLIVLFPGYVFLNGLLNDSFGERLRDVPNIYKLLKDGVRPLKIPEIEVNVFKHLMIEDTIGLSDVIVEGSEIIIVSGPLMSLKGSIIRVDKRKGRAKVAIELLGEMRTVDLGINIIEPVE